MKLESNPKIDQKISDLSEKIDKLYALESLFEDFENYVRDHNYKHDEDGNLLKGENDDYIMENADTPKNKLLDEVIDFLNKKYL